MKNLHKMDNEELQHEYSLLEVSLGHVTRRGKHVLEKINSLDHTDSDNQELLRLTSLYDQTDQMKHRINALMTLIENIRTEVQLRHIMKTHKS